MNRGMRKLFTIMALAAGIWLLLAALMVVVLSPAMRLVTFGLVTGALIVVALYEMHKKDRDWKGTVLILFVFWSVCGLTVYLFAVIHPQQEPKGPLIAAADVTPLNACSGTKIPSDGLLMIIGATGVIGRGRGPFIPFQVGSCPAPSLTRTEGGIEVNAFGYDSDNNVVYRIHDNIFEQVVGGFLTEHRPDRSTIVIRDDHGPTSLEIRYLNRNAVEISGTFRCGDSTPVRILENRTSAGKMPSGRCAALGMRGSPGLILSEPDLAGRPNPEGR